MNIAELSISLTKKDSEKATVQAEIDNIKELQDSGFVGTLTGSITHIDHLPLESEFSISYLVDSAQCQTQSVLENKGLSEPISLLLRSFDTNLEVRCMVDNESYSATLNLSEVPGDTTFTSELDAIGLIDSANVIKMHIKVQADFYHAVLESKAIQLAEVEKDYNEITLAIKDLKRKESKAAPAAPKAKKGVKKGIKKTAKTAQPEPVVEVEEPPSAVEVAVASAIAAVTVGADLAVQHRAYFLFAAASAAVFFYGDMASV